MDSQGLGRAMADSIFVAMLGCVIGGGVAAIVLWELFWFLWEHLSLAWK